MITDDSRNILVADDSRFFRTKLSDILIEAGHKVRFAKSGREVIGELSIDPSKVDLLVLDLQMPDMDGFGVLEWMKEHALTGRFPVLVITSVFEPTEVMTRLKGLGASGMMTKGYSPEQIVFRVNRLLFQNKAETGTKPRTRVPVSIPVDFTIGETTHTGFLLNVSETGAYLHTKYELLAGSSMQIRFSLPGNDRLFEIKCIVRWTTNDISKKTIFGGGGLMFSTISAEDSEELRAFIAEEAKKMGLDETEGLGTPS